MKKTIKVFSIFLLITILILGNTLFAQACSYNYYKLKPIVSTKWLDKHINDHNLIIVDIRTSDEYNQGHIPNSINIPFEVPFSAWITMRDDLLLELPDKSELFESLGSNGITPFSKVVIVSSIAEVPYPQAGANRVADTLLYAGVRNVSILDGGYPKWVLENRSISTENFELQPKTYYGHINKQMFVDIDYTYSKLGKSIILDARDANVYSGEVIEDYANKAGHIPTSLSLPAPYIWNEDGTYKSKKELKKLVESVIGKHKQFKEIIVYCGVGGYGSSWLYVLQEMLGYKNVKMYDGSAQEWVLYYDMEI